MNNRFCLRSIQRAPVRFLQQEVTSSLLKRLIPCGSPILGTHQYLPAGSGSVIVRGKAAWIYWKTASGAAAAKVDVPVATARRE